MARRRKRNRAKRQETPQSKRSLDDTSQNFSINNSPITHTGDPSNIYDASCSITDIPKHLRNYWNHRYSLFSRFDEGIIMDEEGWYSVTPEKLAQHIAQKCTGEDLVIIDAFCGMGGNAIQFANLQTCKKVIAIDICPRKIECAINNAQIYGINEKIKFIHGNTMELLSTLEADIVFLSPPWGGPSYSSHEIFDIEKMNIPGSSIFEIARQVSPNIIYFMPKNSDSEQLAGLDNERCLVENQYLNGRNKSMCVYYGPIFNQ